MLETAPHCIIASCLSTNSLSAPPVYNTSLDFLLRSFALLFASESASTSKAVLLVYQFPQLFNDYIIGEEKTSIEFFPRMNLVLTGF